jgi:hypothetical protein|tara:strand:+ start:104 stop:286 length:183 start_codon:yes stop_codon:yes gene_type:complete
MAITPTTGFSEADIYFNIDDQLIRDTMRQVFDNTRKLHQEIQTLKGRVQILENEKDTDLL